MPRITFTQSLLRPVKETLMNRFAENITRIDFGHKNDPSYDTIHRTMWIFIKPEGNSGIFIAHGAIGCCDLHTQWNICSNLNFKENRFQMKHLEIKDFLCHQLWWDQRLGSYNNFCNPWIWTLPFLAQLQLAWSMAFTCLKKVCITILRFLKFFILHFP